MPNIWKIFLFKHNFVLVLILVTLFIFLTFVCFTLAWKLYIEVKHSRLNNKKKFGLSVTKKPKKKCASILLQQPNKKKSPPRKAPSRKKQKKNKTKAVNCK